MRLIIVLHLQLEWNVLMHHLTGQKMLNLIQTIQSKEQVFMQKDMMFLCKVFNLMLIRVKFTNIFSNYIRKSEIWNDLWQSCVDAQVEYYNDFPMAQSNDLQNTYLFDEFDKHLSIANTINLYTEYLPNVFEKSKPQIILVSHSPIVLSKAVSDTGIYNLVSLDEEYTETCKKRLAEIF